MINSSLDKRLLSCADYVRAGAVFADIGTDHGYLPIFLLKSGRIKSACLSDVNEGPLSSAARNVAESGLSDRCEFVLTDGAAALFGKGITDYAICGMGGVLISEIIDAAEHLKDKNVRLILQPMTRQAHLRKYLSENGFDILDERYSSADGKYYVTLLVEFSGECRELDAIEAELGKKREHTVDRVEYLGYLKTKESSFSKTVRGREQGRLDATEEKKILGAIMDRISELKA